MWASPTATHLHPGLYFSRGMSLGHDQPTQQQEKHWKASKGQITHVHVTKHEDICSDQLQPAQPGAAAGTSRAAQLYYYHVSLSAQLHACLHRQS